MPLSKIWSCYSSMLYIYISMTFFHICHIFCSYFSRIVSVMHFLTIFTVCILQSNALPWNYIFNGVYFVNKHGKVERSILLSSTCSYSCLLFTGPINLIKFLNIFLPCICQWGMNIPCSCSRRFN